MSIRIDNMTGLIIGFLLGIVATLAVVLGGLIG